MKRPRQPVNPDVTKPVQYVGMERQKHFIKEWRKKKGLSLRRLADRLLNDDGSPIISYASLQRIETGEQPYSQDILEALAYALGTSPGALLERDPRYDAQIVDLLRMIPREDHDIAVRMLKSLVKTGT